MEILQGLTGLTHLPPGVILAIGNFDGLHRGHRQIVRTARDLAPRGPVALVTFEPHPLTVLRPEIAPPRLTPPAIKESLICATGVDYLVILPPEPAVLNLTAEEFWAILRDDVRPAALVEGLSFNFGKGRGGTIEKLRQWCAPSPIQLHIVPAVQVPLLDLSIVNVNSSLIRWLLRQGRVRDAAICLGRPYTLEGEVIKGHQRGRTIGVPTANLHCADQLIPADGVYAGRCNINGLTYPAALSIGTMPTFGEHHRQVEAHLVGFDGDLYDQVIRVELLDWLRDQRRFPGLEPLKHQLHRDIQTAEALRTLDPSAPIAAIAGEC